MLRASNGVTKGPAAITPAADESGETLIDDASRQHWPVSSAQPSGETVKRIVGRRKLADLLRQHHQTQEEMQSSQASCYHGGRNKAEIKGKH